MTAHKEIWVRHAGTKMFTWGFWVDDGLVEVTDDREVPVEVWYRFLRTKGFKSTRWHR